MSVDDVGGLADEVLITVMVKTRNVKQAVRRAYVALSELETSRRSEDIDRVRHGVMHELETVMRSLGMDPAQVRAAAAHAPTPRREALRQMAIDSADLYDEDGPGFTETR